MASSFSSKDVGYHGMDRRSYHRRMASDRRTTVRFELDKSDRRQVQGRRKEDGDHWMQRSF